MINAPLRDPPPRPSPLGYLPEPRPASRQYGRVRGLRTRLANWQRVLTTDRARPWLGTGLIEDLRTAMQLLNLREFAEWLRVSGAPEHAEFAAEILSNEDYVEAIDAAAERVEAVDGRPHVAHPATTIAALDEAALQARRDYEAVRDVLVSVGALADDDTETPVADLVRALLS